MLEARSLTKHYGYITAVRQVSFSIGAGEILGYLGPNGAGKLTGEYKEIHSGETVMLARIIREFERQQKPLLLQTCCQDNVCGNKRGF
jgi:ABC-type multidrug transport system ATPase subunit